MNLVTALYYLLRKLVLDLEYNTIMAIASLVTDSTFNGFIKPSKPNKSSSWSANDKTKKSNSNHLSGHNRL